MFSLFHACHLASCSYRCGATLGGGGGGGEHNLHTLQLRLNSPHVLVGNAMHLPQLGIIMLAALSCAALRKEPVTLTAWQTYLATLRFARSCPSQPALIEEPARFRAVPCWIGEGGGQPGIAGWGRSHIYTAITVSASHTAGAVGMELAAHVGMEPAQPAQSALLEEPTSI